MCISKVNVFHAKANSINLPTITYMNTKLKTVFRLISIMLAGFTLAGCGDPVVELKEEVRKIKTYPFSNPNPIPMLVKDSRLYPYLSLIHI